VFQQGDYTVGGDPRDMIFDGTDLWVSNYGDGTVSRVSRTSGAVLATIAVGTKPYGIAYGSGSVWVANYGDDTVDRITAGTVVATIAVGDGPLGLVHDGTDVWVSNHLAGTVKRISPASNTVTATITVGNKPCFLHVRQSNGTIRVANYASNTVGVIDPATNTVVANIDVSSGPFGLADDKDGFMWVACYSSSVVQKVNPDTNMVVGTVALGSNCGPTDCASDGVSMWVSEAQTRQLTRINVDLNSVSGHSNVSSYPRSIVFEGHYLWTPLNTNSRTGSKAVSIYTAPPGGGTSNIKQLTITGVDVSPLPN
jgi:YVTN family beta-propeller protein